MMTGTKASRYLLGGLVIGAFWYINRHRPPWEDAVRTIVLFAIVMSVLKVRLRRKIDVHLLPLVATKGVLVLIAAAIEQAIRHSTSDAALIVACGLFVAVVLVGMIGDRFFFSPADS
jgi:hypothetical protein